MKTDIFQCYGYCCIFQICWHIECSTLTSSPFRILNSSAGIRSPPLVLLVVMFPKAHLTSYSRISGSWWAITLSCLSRSLRCLLYSSSAYSCHLFLIFSAFIGPYFFLFFITLYLTYPWMKCSLDTSNFLEKISRLSESFVFLYFFSLSILMKAFLFLLVSLELYIQLGIYFLFFLAFQFSCFCSYL